MDFNPEDLLILASVKIYPNSVDLQEIDKLIPLVNDWNYFSYNVIERGFGPLFYNKLSLLNNSDLISAEIQENLRQSYYLTLRRNILLYDSLNTILQSFKKNGIEVILLKGICLAEWLYKDIGLRQLSDIDILIKPEQVDKCVKLLNEQGFKSKEHHNISDFIESKTDRVHLPAMVNGLVSVELHTKFHKEKESYRFLPELCWSSATEVTIKGFETNMLQLYDMLIHLCLHLDKHFRGGEVQFYSFADIANLLDQNSDIDWDKFIQRCRMFGCESEVMKYIAMVNYFFGVSIPDKIKETYVENFTDDNKALFVSYLHGYIEIKTPQSAVPNHVQNIKKISFIEKLRYIDQLIFPSKQFLIEKYKLVGSKQSVVGSIKLQDSDSNQNYKLQAKNYKLIFWWLWYPYRWWVGVNAVGSILKRKIYKL